MGALYVEGNEPALSGTLIKVQVNANSNVCVESEPIRGNVVMTDATEAIVIYAPDCEYISLGCPVPDVLDMNFTDAVLAIDVNHTLGNVAYQCDEVEAADEVLSQDPAGGILVACGSDVNLVVSTGPAVVPNVVGMADWTAAVAAIEAADLVAAPSGVWTGATPKDEVISQNPVDGGTIVPCGSTVAIVVSRGPQPPNPMPAGAEYDTQRTDCDTYIANVWDPNSGSGGWGKPYHCVGDTAGDLSGFPYNYRVFNSDLQVFINNWMKKAGPWPNGANPAADINHKSSGFPYNYRVFNKDLERFVCYWMKKDVDINAVHGVPACPLTDAQNNAWTCPW